MTKDEIILKTAELSEKIIELSVNALLLNLRFLTKAVTTLKPMPYKGTLATDGRFMYYSPLYMLRRYKQGERLPVHDHLHIIMHCVFRHWYIGGGMEKSRWDAACDIAAEALIIDIGLFENERLPEKKRIISQLRTKLNPLTAEKLYSYFEELPDERIAEFNTVFHTDDHKTWYKPEEREYEPEEEQTVLGLGYPDDNKDEGDDAEDSGGEGGDQPDGGKEEDREENGDGQNGAGENDENGEKQTEENDENAEGGGDNNGDGDTSDTADGMDGEDISDLLARYDNNDEARMNALKQLEKMWKDIARQIQMELGHFQKNAGKESQNLVQALEEVNRERYDYSAFLKKFAVMGEAIRPDLDTFEYGYYAYGMSLYKNVALIEPLEYKEVKRIRDFVIAIDTSGSVSGALVQSFVQKTFDILNSENSFFKKVNIYIIQCDTEVREAVKITCREDFEKYIKTMELKGLGGTDFRPVFEYVHRLNDNKEFSNLKGLIYFTDGYGEFPAKKPPYDTAFVFMRSDYETSGCPDVPPWAVKLILEDRDIMGVDGQHGI